MHDLVIIGSGPAGLTAALYAGRYRRNSLILEKMGVGGQIILSPTIENYPGFPGGISTVELTDRFHKQIQELGINVEMSEVLAIYKASESEKPVYKVVTKEKSYDTKSIIIATGSQPKKLGVPGEDKLVGRGISYCATCDAPFFRNKDIVVIGAGDRAIEEAIFLSSYGKKVTVIHRRNELRASEILQEKARSNPKIEFILESVVEEILGKDRVSAVRIKNVKSGYISDLECQGAFVFTGIMPNTDFVKDILKIDDLGFIITDDSLKTSLGGVFACGDCRRKTLYQVVTACADGAIAAASAHNYLL